MENRELLWLPHGERKQGISVEVCPEINLPRDGKTPKHVWSLSHFRNKSIVPPITLKLTHGESAFLEDGLNDWRTHAGKLIFRGPSCGGHWLILEY